MDGILEYYLEHHERIRRQSQVVPATPARTEREIDEKVSSAAGPVLERADQEVAGRKRQRHYSQSGTFSVSSPKSVKRRKETDRRVDEAARDNTRAGDL